MSSEILPPLPEVLIALKNNMLHGSISTCMGGLTSE